MIQEQDTSPFLKENYPKKRMLCSHNAGGFPDYTIFICKFETDECFFFMKSF